MKKKLFSVFKKKLANGTEMYYYTTYDEKGKRRQYSTGKTDQQEAYQECYRLLAEGKLLKKSKMILEKYTANWFEHNSCPYYSLRISKGKKFSKSSLDNKRRILNKHILPVFGSKRLDHITTVEIENWLLNLKDNGYAVNTINIIFSVLQLIMSEAVRTGFITYNPCSAVIKYTAKKKEKGILTDKEVKMMFDESTMDEIWGSKLHFLLNYTALITGCRVGEILALTRDKIQDGYLEISESYDKHYGLKSTKTGVSRFVPIPKSLEKKLLELDFTNKGKFIFSSTQNFESPVSYMTVIRIFKRAMEKVGVDYRERNITFHSYRHKANTSLREKGVSEVLIREIIGHKSPTMTDHYSHVDIRKYRYEELIHA